MTPSKNSKTTVLVTGASGYIATHCVQQLLADGYKVRGTVRSLSNIAKIKPLTDLAHSENLELVEADLEKSEDWPKVVPNCTYILHVASPFPIVADACIIRTAIEGTLNVLRAANGCFDVRKVVLTSSCSAINEGHDAIDSNRIFDENDWTNLDSTDVTNYPRSKTLAERAAWDYVKDIKDGNRFELTVLNPTLVVGPLLMDGHGASITIIGRFFDYYEMPAIPRLQLALVDVRDVARAHVLAMTNEKTNGQRLLITAQPSFWFEDIAKVLADEFNQQGYWTPRYRAPYAILWLYSHFDRQAKSILHRIGREVKFDNSKAREQLQMEFTPPSQSLIDMTYSMIERGILPKKSRYHERSSSENS